MSLMLSVSPATTDLPGGEEASLLIDGVVLKQVQDASVSAWAQLVLASAQPDGYLIPAPLSASNGSWIIDGWIATEFIDDLTPLHSQPELVIDVGERFADAVTATNVSDLRPVLARTDRWAVADRYVWNEEQVELSSQASELIAAFRSRIEANDDPAQIIHGDLTENVFADSSGTPVVLDFSPFIRPKRIATAIVVADNLLWHGAESGIVDLISGDEDGLARALLFRLVAKQLAQSPRHFARLTDYERVLGILDW